MNTPEIDELFDRLLNRSSRCMTQDGAGNHHWAVKAKISDLEALRAALQAPSQTTWVSVPREPTKEMVEAGRDSITGHISYLAAHVVYTAMLAAAPDKDHSDGGQTHGHSTSPPHDATRVQESVEPKGAA